MRTFLPSLARPSDEERKAAAWARARPIPGSDPALVRRDCDGRIIVWSEYGLRSDFGWQIDHIVPLSLGGPDSLGNLRARHWRGNMAAGTILGNALRNMAR